MTSTIKVNTITTESGSTLTVGGCGKTVALASGASQTGFGRTGTVDWQTTKKTTAFTAVNGEGYFVDTAASGAVTMTLPASPSAGNIVAVKDYNGNFATANLTIGRNGSPINGANDADVVIKTAGASIVLVYVDASQGWVATQDDESVFSGQAFVCASGGTESNCGNFKIHTFTGPGTFTVNSVASTASDNVVDYLVVAGGGSGGNGNGNSSGGGGAGGVRASATTYTNGGPSAPRTPTSGPTAVPGITVTAQGYPIVVGAGDAGQSGPQPNPGTRRGSDSSGLGITSTGGGAGGYHAGGGGPGNSGGSGGGASGGGLSKTAGAGNTPPVSPAQGSSGGARPGTPPDGSAGAGGGMMTAGADAQPPSGATNRVAQGGAGGGFPSAFGTSGENCGSFYYFGGGGGGAGSQATPAPVANASGGIGGGGNISTQPGPGPDAAGTSGTANTGGGGAGNNNDSYPVVSASGGSGIVIIRYKFQ